MRFARRGQTSTNYSTSLRQFLYVITLLCSLYPLSISFVWNFFLSWAICYQDRCVGQIIFPPETNKIHERITIEATLVNFTVLTLSPVYRFSYTGNFWTEAHYGHISWSFETFPRPFMLCYVYRFNIAFYECMHYEGHLLHTVQYSTKGSPQNSVWTIYN